jgi:hypothetical protein
MQKASFYTRAKTEEIANRTIPLLFETPSTDPYFPLLIERITILGVDGILPSENAFHFAFGTPKVFRYYVSPFPPVRSNISCPLILDANGKSRVENAAFYGLSEEVRLLLQQEGNSLEAAIKGAGEGGERALVEQLLFQKRMHNVMENIATFFQSLLIFGPPGVSSTS